MEADSAGGTAPRRVLFFGWGAAAERVLDELSIFSGRGVAVVSCLSHLKQASDTDLREVCRRHNFPCTLCDTNREVYDVACNFAPDLIISASYRKKLPMRVLELCPDRINFHPSLLPRHRGCWSGFWAIFEGDPDTGVTCHRMVEEFDEGRILHQERHAIASDDTSVSIYKKLLPVTATCARHVLGFYFGEGLPEGDEQTGPSSYHFRGLPYDGLIQAEWSDEQVDRFIRAMYFPPFDGAAVEIGGQRIFVNSVEELHGLRRAAVVSAAAVAECTVVAATAATASAAVAEVPADCAMPGKP